MKKVLLVGCPNVGKSVIFTRLTGVNIIAANYPGTTIEFTEGYMDIGGEKAMVIDTPGTYSLTPTNRAEEVTLKMLDEGADIIINVVDATNLERNLNLTLQLLKRKVPVLVDLNFWDETEHLGIGINVEKFEKLLEVPVVTTCALTGEGIKSLHERLIEAKASKYTFDDGERWREVGNITEQVQLITHRHHTIMERLGDASVKPVTGIPIAFGMAFLMFWLIRLVGEWIIGNIGEPVFEKLWTPVMLKLSGLLGSSGFIHDMLVGKLVDGEIDYGESFGIFTTGLFVPFAAVLPYILIFYFVLGVLEDTGYLPRLAVLVDAIMHKLGLHGLGIIPMMLGLGCNVPGALATRILETKRQRFIAATLMAIAVPCAALQAMMVGLVGKSVKALFIVYGTLFIVWLCLGLVLNKMLKGESPETFMEIPRYRIPYWGAVLKKLWMRVVWFLKEAVPFVILGVFLANLLYTFRIIEFLGNLAKPVVTGILGLPKEAVGALVLGFLRKDVAVGMLVPLGLTVKQLIVASVVLAMSFPCVATFVVLGKELGVKDLIKATTLMVFLSLVVGGILNLVL